ncbi:ATP-dependent DNA helicase [Podosphaera aphanis]|nr:ATP-dependent DNA helicase [Podosphaera aphanis]
MDDENYDEIADEDLIEAISHSPQIPFASNHLDKRQIRGGERLNDRTPNAQWHNFQDRYEDDTSEEDIQKNKEAVFPSEKHLRVNPTDASPGSSPRRMTGPVFKKARIGDSTESSGLFDTLFCTQTSHQSHNEVISQDYLFGAELEGLPSDAFSSPEPQDFAHEPIVINSSLYSQQSASHHQVTNVQSSLRQTTLFGRSTTIRDERPLQTKKVQKYKIDQASEPPTHHILNTEALKTWVFPMNLGTIRDYQYTIVKNGLFNNLLVALPTGLGKTFIAATIMLNYFRWTRNAQIIFVAPTKPLVAQQVDACFNIVGIPKSQTTMLTGEQAPALRAEEWALKRVFFMTPQTLENDLTSGIAEPKRIVLVVVDEAHRATGNYSYVRVVSFLRRFNRSFRVLALTATPGSSVEAVQEVIDNLEISKVEIRTEESLDIQKYVHRRDIDKILLEPSEEIMIVKELLSKSLQPLVNMLCTANAYWNRDPMALTPFGMVKARATWMQSEAGRRANPGHKGMMNSLFAVLASVAHSIKLLNFHGISPFYSAIKDFRDNGDDPKKPGKYRNQVIESSDFKKMMDKIQSWLNADDFIGHPKMTALCDTILNHFLDAGDGIEKQNQPPSTTRVIVFAEYRDSAEEITRVLNKHAPLIRASVFVGQADSKRSEGMNQKQQIKAIQDFSSGKFNVIVATSIGEEGLDIGQVDLIVCYDSSASPIRMLQRMGRTGRKRAGKIVLLLMKGKEEESFTRAKDNYEQMQKVISSGERFDFRYDLSTRIIPRDVTPVVDKQIIEVPVENTQNPGLPEPRRRAVSKKKPAKRFNMPDDAETMFTKASNVDEEGRIRKPDAHVTPKSKKMNKNQLAPVPPAKSVFLDSDEEDELEQRYRNIDDDEMQEVSMPEMTVQTVAQRSLRPVGTVAHGRFTKRCVRLFKTLAIFQRPEDREKKPYGDQDYSMEDFEVPTLIDESKLCLKPAFGKKDNIPKEPRKKKTKAVSRERPTEQMFIRSEADVSLSPLQYVRNIFEEPEILGATSSEGEGDDIMISSELSEDGSDDGEDLRGFIDDENS